VRLLNPPASISHFLSNMPCLHKSIGSARQCGKSLGPECEGQNQKTHDDTNKHVFDSANREHPASRCPNLSNSLEAISSGFRCLLRVKRYCRFNSDLFSAWGHAVFTTCTGSFLLDSQPGPHSEVKPKSRYIAENLLS